MVNASPAQSAQTARPVAERLVDAAFALFDERGYEQTTVEDIAERAQVSRTTFFRHYRSKEEVIFPRHEVLIDSIKQRLATSTERTALVAVSEAVRLVLLSYLDEGERARQRYQLTSRVGALRDREIASGARYQRLFREFISSWVGPASLTALQAELMAAAVVAAHNHVLRRWLRGESDDPVTEVDDALAHVVGLFTAPEETLSAPRGTTVVVLQSDRPLDQVLPALRRAVAGE
jgi:AcrR family transcriptional regulator